MSFPRVIATSNGMCLVNLSQIVIDVVLISHFAETNEQMTMKKLLLDK